MHTAGTDVALAIIKYDSGPKNNLDSLQEDINKINFEGPIYDMDDLKNLTIYVGGYPT